MADPGRWSSRMGVHGWVRHAGAVLDDFDDVLARARTGAGDAFALLYRDLSRPVAAYVRAQGVADVEDVTSEVFLSVFTGIDRFSGDQAGFRSWVFTIAHHRVTDQWRRASRSVPVTPYDPVDDERTVPSAEAGALDAIGSQEVVALLDRTDRGAAGGAGAAGRRRPDGRAGRSGGRAQRGRRQGPPTARPGHPATPDRAGGRAPVSLFDDNQDVRADEQLLAGLPVPGSEALSSVLSRMRALADEPAPAPTPALAALLRDGLPAAEGATRERPTMTRTRALRAARWGTGLGLAGKILLGAGVAAAAVAGTATIPAVPDAVQVPVRTALTDIGHLISGQPVVPAPAPTASVQGAAGRDTDRPSTGSTDRGTGPDDRGANPVTPPGQARTGSPVVEPSAAPDRTTGTGAEPPGVPAGGPRRCRCRRLLRPRPRRVTGAASGGAPHDGAPAQSAASPIRG